MSQPGWYPDPAAPTMRRWWDGRAWTGAVQPAMPGPPGYGVPTPARDLDEESRTGRRAAVALIAGAVAYGAQYLVYATWWSSVARSFRTWLHAPDGPDGVKPPLVIPHGLAIDSSSSLISAALLAVGIVFLLWFYKAVTVARRLGLPARWSPPWAIIGWVIPVVNFWFPYQSAIDCLPPGHSGRSVVGRWWALWVVGQAAGIATAVAAFTVSSHVALVVAFMGIVIVAAAAQAGGAVIREVNRVHAGLLGR